MPFQFGNEKGDFLRVTIFFLVLFFFFLDFFSPFLDSMVQNAILMLVLLVSGYIIREEVRPLLTLLMIVVLLNSSDGLGNKF